MKITFLSIKILLQNTTCIISNDNNPPIYPQQLVPGGSNTSVPPESGLSLQFSKALNAIMSNATSSSNTNKSTLHLGLPPPYPFPKSCHFNNSNNSSSKESSGSDMPQSSKSSDNGSSGSLASDQKGLYCFNLK